MENKKKPSAFYARLVKVFRTRAARNVIFFLLFVLSVFCMFLLDEGNFIRNELVAGLNGNFIQQIMSYLNIGTFNITLEAWLLFLCIMFAFLFWMLSNIFAPKFVARKVAKKREKFHTELGARRFYTFIYYLIVLLIVAAIIFVFVMAGGFDMFNREVAGIFLNLVYTMLLCIMFLAISILLIVIAIVALAFVCWLVAQFVMLVMTFIKDVEMSRRKKEEEAFKELSDIRPDMGGNGGKGGGDGGGSDSVVASLDINPALEKDLFPSLTLIDRANEEPKPATESDEITLDEMALRFQSYACNHHKIYYELPLIRSFIAGLAASRLMILQGLSGTGKSMLPRMFARFTGSDVFFSPVQATWRDKTDVLGFFSEFTKTFKITDFLHDIYSASYTDKMTMMVLDEMNLSRIEYYFADFLSILEYPKEEWRIKVYEPEIGQKLPVKLGEGYVTIPANTWFIGTANTDDSTFTITDKVYDRAITLDFRERFAPINSHYNSDPISISAERLEELFEEAKQNERNCLSQQDTDKFIRICDFIKDAFDIRFGNRIMVQINQFVPVYVALGGSKEEALDFMLATKVLRKLDGMFEDYVKDELVSFTRLLNSTYGKGVFKETERIVAKLLKRLV